MTSSSDELRRHSEKMAKKKAVRDKMLAAKTEARGLVLVNTGTAKGKSTAAFGLVLRALGHGFRVGVIQFVKGKRATGERVALERFDDLCTIEAMGEGFTWETQDQERDRLAAERAWDASKALLANPEIRLVVLDELNIVLRYGLIEVGDVIAVLAARPADQHVVITGRNAPDALVEAADLVTDMSLVKHPFRSGVKPQAGIEF